MDKSHPLPEFSEKYTAGNSVGKFIWQIIGGIIVIAILSWLTTIEVGKRECFIALCLCPGLLVFAALFNDLEFCCFENQFEKKWNKLRKKKLAEINRPRPKSEIVYLNYICPICKHEIGKESFEICPKCRTVHHADCWDYNEGHCSIYGCNPIRRPKLGEIGYR